MKEVTSIKEDFIKDIKAIILDLDGTLLTDNQQISSYTAKVLNQLQERSIKLIIASGRTPFMAKKFTQVLNLNVPMILANGAIIYNPVDNKIIEALSVDKKIVKDLLEFAKKNDLNINIYTETNIYINKRIREGFVESSGTHMDNISDINELDLKEVVLKCEFYGTDIVNNDFLRTSIKKIQDLNNIELYLSSAHKDYLEVMNSKVNKYNGIKILLELLNLSPNEVIAFGDNENDIEMLYNLPFSVAMGNAKQKVKNNATFVALGNNEDGIGKFLEMINNDSNYHKKS